ncbi:hypothetical protein [Phytohabitans houttuyneae]|uniref:Uncharacterized protein n=1 Tax=Phytohabitans houttuyneae TaxID=1076126 RepID=A0A6V8KRD5_9ACTN|nr:hypothetical protein [Phytohabitans houttuyneae]GFJ84819.1 hypothetical protein Phou_089990 [Phytohabitans houttuyneae]
MRIVRTAAGMLLLTIGLPVLLVGGALWTAMQHRDAEGAFSGRVERITTPGHAVVVPDLDALLRRDAPFARAGDTRLRVTARTEAGPALVAIAPAEEVARYLAGAAYAQVDRVSLTAGPLPVGITPVAGTAVPAAQPAWQVSGAGGVGWASSEVRGQRLALVVMHPDARAGMTVDLRVEVRPGWLSTATWGLLLAGGALIVLGMATLAWPTRRQVPAARPATLADVLTPPAPVPAQPGGHARSGWAAPTPMPVQPILAWPPHPSVGVTPTPLAAPDLGQVAAGLEMDGPARGGSRSGEPEAIQADDADEPGEPPEAEPEAPGPDLPGSADLASALGALGTGSRSTRRRKTAAGLPTEAQAPQVPPVSPPTEAGIGGHPRRVRPREQRSGPPRTSR